MKQQTCSYSMKKKEGERLNKETQAVEEEEEVSRMTKPDWLKVEG